jgi:hypothetical protein
MEYLAKTTIGIYTIVGLKKLPHRFLDQTTEQGLSLTDVILKIVVMERTQRQRRVHQSSSLVKIKIILWLIAQAIDNKPLVW